MNLKKVLLITFIIINCTSVIIAQTVEKDILKEYSTIAELIIRKSLTENVGYEWLKELCQIGPRLSGSEQSMRAIIWAEEKMHECGFEKIWLQPVMVPKWKRGNTEIGFISKSVKNNGRKLNITALGGSIGTPINGITAKIIEVKNFDDLKILGEKVKGKIVFYNRSFDQGLVNTFEGYGKAVDQRSRGAIEAAKYGAVAAIVRSVTSKNDNIPHTGVMQYDTLYQKIPSCSIGIQDADFLSNQLKEDPNLEVTLKMDCENLPEVQSYNVIGEITGSEFPNEIIVVGGHFDSWDKGCGAHDDGAPCIQTMEVLDLIKRAEIKPKRTIRCVLFINEENGSRGGIEYGNYAAHSDEIHIAAIESDRGAFTPRGFSVTADSTIIQNMQRWLPLLNMAHIDWIRPGGSGVDVSYIKNTKALLGYVPDDQRYMDVHHSDNDTYETVHPREMQLGTAAITIMALLLSNEL